jgi:Domain of unknown function (DUF4365)
LSKDKGHASRKRRTREHIIADLAVNHLERQVLRCGFTMHRIVHDYGIDLVIRTYTPRGEVESGAIWVQVKATDHPQQLRGQPALAVRVHRKDVLAWIREVQPVILVVYDARADMAYWLHVPSELHGGKLFEATRTGPTLTLHLPFAQVVNEEAVNLFRQLKADSLGQWD